MKVKKLIEEFDENTIRNFVQINPDYYLEKWKTMASTGSKVSWNWASFLGTILWLGYRKMYFFAFISILLVSISAFKSLGILRSLLPLGIWIGVGIFGNYLYGRYTYNKLLKLKIAFSDENIFKEQSTKSGGTTVGGIFIAILMVLGVILTVGMILFVLAIFTWRQW
jgi:hypothetical protein